MNHNLNPGSYIISDNHPTVPGTSLKDAQGRLYYGMTNDYMFRAVLQSNEKVLRGLICSMLHLAEEEILSIRILNSIILGKAIEEKECRLDINIRLNNHALINLEMQIANKLNWPDRSLVYLCRSFDTLRRGQDYREAKPVIHIGFLDYTLFHEYPEFYATYRLLNVKNHQLYSDNLTLSVVDLSQIELATEEDKRYHIDYWASLFKATTWEEIKMLAAKDEYLNEAAETIFELSSDEQIRKRCRDREEYYQDMRNYDAAILERDTAISDYKWAITKRDNIISGYKKDLAERDNTISGYEKDLAERDSTIATQEAQIRQLYTELKNLKSQK